MFYKRDTCRLCNNKSIENILHIADTPVGDAFIPVSERKKIQSLFPLDLVLCKTCGLLQVSGVVDSELIYKDYLYETSVSLGLVKHFNNYAKTVLETLRPEKGSLIVDIGSNDGSLLNYFRLADYKVLGIEPAKLLAEKAINNNVETIAEYFSAELAEKIKNSKGCAAIITANNVIANIDNLCDFIEGIKILLAKDGVFIFETGYGIDLIQNCILDNVYHEHLSYFTLKPLLQFFNSHNMEIIDAERTHTKGGSIRVTVQFKGGFRQKNLRVDELFNLETELGYNRMIPFTNFVDQVGSIKHSLISLLKKFKKEGNSISGYGASVGVTTLIYHFGLEKTVDHLFDDNPLKYDTLSPGCHIPVYSSAEISKYKPDYIIIFAWRYSEIIISKHKQYLLDGGHFILPFPGIEIV